MPMAHRASAVLTLQSPAMRCVPIFFFQQPNMSVSQTVNVGLYDETHQNVHDHNILYWDQNFMSK